MTDTYDVASASLSVPLPRRWRISWPLLLGLAGFLIPVYIGWGLADSDTYFHIAAGRWMLAHGAIPTHDSFSFTMPGAPWTAQEWLSELLLAATYQTAGWSGLVFLGAVSFGATVAYLSRFLLTRMEPLHALLLTCLAALMMFPSLLARPHALVWPLTALWVGELIQSSETGHAPPWWLVPVMLLWVNMHGSFIVGLGIAVVVAIEAIANATRARWQALERWAPFTLAAFGATLMNPHGYRLLSFPFHLLGMKHALGLIMEWRPPDFTRPQMLEVWLLVVVGLAFLGRLRLSLIRSVLVLGFLLSAIQHARNVALLGLISPILLAEPIASLWWRNPVPGRNAEMVDRWFRSLAPRTSLPTAALALLLAGSLATVTLAANRPQPPDTTTPRSALDALLSRGPPGRIFNDYDFGCYLIFRDVPVFVDGRVDLYGDAFITQTLEAETLAPGGDLEGLLAKYRIDAILLRTPDPAVKLLDRMPGWERVYGDKVAVAYVRRQEHTS